MHIPIEGLDFVGRFSLIWKSCWNKWFMFFNLKEKTKNSVNGLLDCVVCSCNKWSEMLWLILPTPLLIFFQIYSVLHGRSQWLWVDLLWHDIIQAVIVALMGQTLLLEILIFALKQGKYCHFPESFFETCIYNPMCINLTMMILDVVVS